MAIENVRLFEAEKQRAPALAQADRNLQESEAKFRSAGELAASLAHEIKQPIAAARTHACAAMRWLDRSPPSG